MTKINKALDINKLFQEHAKGKLLKKQLEFPMYSPIKYDGNYIVAIVDRSKPTFHTSGGLEYTHTDEAGDFFAQLPDAVYLAERIYGKGLLGDRNKCNLKGPKHAQTSTGHSYKVFDIIPIPEYYDGIARLSYESRVNRLTNLLDELELYDNLAGKGKYIMDQQELDDYLNLVVKGGYEGVMCVQPNWKWADTKSRKVTMCKYKKRPTVDLLVIDALEGTGKYEGLIGSLRLIDSEGKVVDVGSGMSDEDRHQDHDYFIGKVVEVFYEQIVETYIQPTFGSEYEGVLIRHDKTEYGID